MSVAELDPRLTSSPPVQRVVPLPVSAWRVRHAGKVTTPEAAVRRIAAGKRIFVGSGAAEPARLVEALVSDGDHLADNEIFHIMTLGPAPYAKPGLEARFRHVAFFIGENVREAVQDGRADYVPVFLSEVPRLIASPRARVDVALIQTSLPDEHGYVSLGVSVDIVRAAIDTASLIIAEVNPHMPRTFGDSFLHVDRIAALVPVDYELPERKESVIDDIAGSIGRHVATLVPDGATLQVGIGTLPDAVLAALSDRSDLGVHTEMVSDGVMKLVLSGAITGRKKTLLPGKIVTSFLLGSRELYHWSNENPVLELRPSDFTNDPLVIARNDEMIAINGALAVDLTGQVAADTIEGRFFSGIGGQVDFIRGAARSRGGKPIIAMRSTARKGTVSRIQPIFDAGAGVVTSRGDVHYVVTEYGVADLWGRSVRERALALIEIAHPNHRGELLAAAKGRKYVFMDQRAPRRAAAAESSRAEKLSTGEPVLVRAVLPSDETAVQGLFYGLSEESSRQRFFGSHRLHPHAEVEALVGVDGETTLAFVVFAGDELVGYASAVGVGKDKTAEIAFVVREGWHRRGIGRLLLERLVVAARERGAKALEAYVLVHNQPMMRLLEKAGNATTRVLRDGVYHVVTPLSCTEAEART